MHFSISALKDLFFTLFRLNKKTLLFNRRINATITTKFLEQKKVKVKNKCCLIFDL